MNNSGLDNVAKDLAAAETKLGHDSKVVSSVDSSQWEKGMGAEIHVSHSHVPDPIRKASGKLVWVGHGTPEHCFQTAVEEGLTGKYGHADTWMLIQWWLQHADALVTFWPRHQKIWQSLCDKGKKVYCFPLGVNKDFWISAGSKGKYAGNPSVFTAENCHYIKWPLDLVLIWPWVTEEMPETHLHFIYLPRDQHRWWFPLMNRNGSAFKSYIFGNKFGHDDLRNAFCSVDYLIQMVRYGDYNRLGLEAKACGCKVISFAGNPYADFWLTEGNQDRMVQELLIIFRKEVEPLSTFEVPDIQDTAKEMIKIYEEIL